MKRYGFANTDLGWNCLCGCFNTRGRSQDKKARQSAKRAIEEELEEYLLTPLDEEEYDAVPVPDSATIRAALRVGSEKLRKAAAQPKPSRVTRYR